jgi:hypothetical protein
MRALDLAAEATWEVCVEIRHYPFGNARPLAKRLESG